MNKMIDLILNFNWSDVVLTGVSIVSSEVVKVEKILQEKVYNKLSNR
ncbi:MAG: hypothetical protein RBT61_07675 [Candidatus Kapabacteria bacterium]|jgi:hypothetical protein|nr:hypothetical protein [Candidatus Kapabacteria bacterium]